MNKVIAIAMALFVITLAPATFAAEPSAPDVVGGDAGIVEGAGVSPVVEFVWVLPDEDNLTAGTQLEVLAYGQRDDIYACVVVTDDDSRDTIADVFIDLYHPDGSFKYQIHGVRLDNVADADAIEACKTDALNAGLITSQDWEDINYRIFDQQISYMYEVWLPMFYHQPSGEYRAEAWAVDTTSRASVPVDAFFTWVPGTFLGLDFTSVDFGNIQPGAWKIVNGDLVFSLGDGMPTVRNEGNTEVIVGLEISEFVGTGSNPNKVIDDFDAQLRNLGTNNHDSIPGEHLEFVADQFVQFTYPIELCRQEKLDFSIHADVGTLPDAYSGNVTVYADPNIVDAPEPDTYPYPRCGVHMDPDATCPLV
ncbi:MAG: hypothetical protein OXR66_01110 [Candidatus Woesearchaeota archaeon]|nr:hypothetical protein [Candidatus Woesearchaeota archaeon]